MGRAIASISGPCATPCCAYSIVPPKHLDLYLCQWYSDSIVKLARLCNYDGNVAKYAPVGVCIAGRTLSLKYAVSVSGCHTRPMCACMHMKQLRIPTSPVTGVSGEYAYILMSIPCAYPFRVFRTRSGGRQGSATLCNGPRCIRYTSGWAAAVRSNHSASPRRARNVNA